MTKEGLFFQRETERSTKMLLKQALNSKPFWDWAQKQEDHKSRCSQPGRFGSQVSERVLRQEAAPQIKPWKEYQPHHL